MKINKCYFQSFLGSLRQSCWSICVGKGFMMTINYQINLVTTFNVTTGELA